MSDVIPGVDARLAAAELTVDGARNDGGCAGPPNVKPGDGDPVPEDAGLVAGAAPNSVENGFEESAAGVADAESSFEVEAAFESLANLMGEFIFQVLSAPALAALGATIDGVPAEAGKGVWRCGLRGGSIIFLGIRLRGSRSKWVWRSR